MGDLKVLDGGKPEEPTINMSQVICAQCSSGLFNWKADDTGKVHVIACSVCGNLFPMLESENSNVLEHWEERD